MTRGRATFVAVVVGIAAFIAVMAYLEPRLHDGWHFRRYAQTQSFLDDARSMYLDTAPTALVRTTGTAGSPRSRRSSAVSSIAASTATSRCSA